MQDNAHVTGLDNDGFVSVADPVGTIQSPVVNSGGVLFPAPQIQIGSTYTQKQGGTLSVRLGGGAGSGNIVVTDTATLAGTVAMTADAALTPQLGANIDVVTAGSLSGRFTHVASSGFTDANTPYAFQPNYGADGTVGAVIVADYNDNHPLVGYQGWKGLISSGASGASFRYACAANQTATFAFSGTAITLNTAHGPEFGNARVLIDGVSKGVLDLYSPTTTGFTQRFANLGAGPHTIVVNVLGTNNPAATNSCVIVDGFKVGNTVTTRTGPDQGKARVLVDGIIATTVNLYAPTAHTGVRVLVPTTGGSHLVSIIALGSKDAASTGTAVVIDDLIVH